MITVYFRHIYPFDGPIYGPALEDVLGAEPDIEFHQGEEPCPDFADRTSYLIGWRLKRHDKTSWPHLKAVMGLAAGIDAYKDHPAFPEQARLVRMIDPALANQMAEYVCAYALRFHRSMEQQEAEIRAGGWREKFTVPPTADKTSIGIMGLGEMGTQTALMLRGIGFQVRGWSRSRKDIEGVATFAGADAFQDFLSGTDILVCLLPLTLETENIINRECLSFLPRGACLIHAGRGQQLVEQDLLDALDSGHIRAAALDVFREEPIPENHPFRNHASIFCTPHMAAITRPESGARAILQAIRDLERGESPAGLVDFSKGY